MKKEIVRRCLLGMPIGITISYLISIIISYLAGSKEYIPCAPAFLALFASSLQAVCADFTFGISRCCFQSGQFNMEHRVLESFETKLYPLFMLIYYHVSHRMADALDVTYYIRYFDLYRFILPYLSLYMAHYVSNTKKRSSAHQPAS
nr:DUF3021 family protein [Faecalicoccus pleomorphus]